MFLHITSARYIDRYRIELRFNNDREGIVDLSESLEGKVFQPLQDLAFFKQFDMILLTLIFPFYSKKNCKILFKVNS